MSTNVNIACFKAKHATNGQNLQHFTSSLASGRFRLIFHSCAQGAPAADNFWRLLWPEQKNIHRLSSDQHPCHRAAHFVNLGCVSSVSTLFTLQIIAFCLAQHAQPTPFELGAAGVDVLLKRFVSTNYSKYPSPELGRQTLTTPF